MADKAAELGEVSTRVTDFLAKVIELSVRANCLLFFAYEGRFVQPSSVAVFEALNRSPAARLARKEIVPLKMH